MDVREKLVKLFQHDDCPLFMVFGDKVDVLADYLIANGVTVVDKFATTEQQWISVKDRLPDKDGAYLVFERGYLIPSIRVLSFARDGRKVDKYDFYREWKNVWYRYDSEWGHLTIDNVTHWMPLPKPPKGE